MLAITVNIPRVDVHVHHQDPEIASRLDGLAAAIAELKQQGVHHMEVTQQVRDVLTEIDTATTELAGRVEAVITKAVDSMDQSEADPLLAEARAIATRLRGIAADPAAPVPPVEPVEPPPGA
jgi:hypothetical protein